MQDRHSRTIIGPKRTLGLTYLLDERLKLNKIGSCSKLDYYKRTVNWPFRQSKVSTWNSDNEKTKELICDFYEAFKTTEMDVGTNPTKS